MGTINESSHSGAMRSIEPGISRFRVRASARPGMTAKAPALLPLPLQIFLHFRAQSVAQIGARHGEGDVGAQEAGLGAAIMPFASEFDAVEFLGFGKAD